MQRDLLENLLLQGTARDDSVDIHHLLLTDSVGSICALFVHGWVPVEVVEDDSVGTCEVDSEAARARGEDEAEDTVIVVEAVSEDLSLLDFGSAVET